MTTMKEFQSHINKKAIYKMGKGIEEAIKDCETGLYYPWVDAIIEGEFSLNDRNEVARKYIEEGGWYAVAHRTSSENGERAGLTCFELFTPESYEKWNKAYGEGYKNRGHIFFNHTTKEAK